MTLYNITVVVIVVVVAAATAVLVISQNISFAIIFRQTRVHFDKFYSFTEPKDKSTFV